MAPGNDQQRSEVFNLFKTYRHFVVTSIVFCVLAASAYLFFFSPQYKVQIKLAVIGSQQTSGDVIKYLRSEAAVQKAVHALPLEVRYYYDKGLFKKTEVYGDSLPIKFVLQKGSVFNSSTKIVAQVLNGQMCKVDENDISTDVPLNHPVKFSLLNYTVMKGPAFNAASVPLTIKFSKPEDLTESFGKALDAKVLNDKTFELSVRVDNIQKGRDFLNKLIEIFNTRNAGTGRAEKVYVAGYTETLTKLSDSIDILQARVQGTRQQQLAVAHVPYKPTGLSGKQKIALDVLTAIKPYVMRPTGLFVLIPDGYEVNDKHIEELISNFNETELDKQKALQMVDAADPAIKALDAKISLLKQDMLTSIAGKEQQIMGKPQLAALKDPQAVNDTLAQINALINSKQKEYNSLLQHTDVKASGRSPMLTVVEKTDAKGTTFSRTLLIYLIALITGLLLPVIILAIGEYINHSKRMAL